MKKPLLFFLMAVMYAFTVHAAEYTIEFLTGTGDGIKIGADVTVQSTVTDNSKIYVGDASNVFTSPTNAYYKSSMGLKFGASGKAGSAGFALSNLDNLQVTAIKINAAYYDNVKDADMGIKVYINSQEVGSVTGFQQAALSDQTLTLSSPVSPTEIKLETYNTENATVTSTYQARAFIHSITFITEDGGGGEDPVEKHIGNLTGKYGDTAIENEANISVSEGTAFTFAAENADEISVKQGEGEPIALQVADGSASWTPAVCQATPVTVTATMNGETPETETLSFTLTVEENGGETPIEGGSYLIEFANNAKSATLLSTSTQATTFIAENSRQFFPDKPIEGVSSAYYGDEQNSIRLGKSKTNGSLTLTLSDAASTEVASFIVTAKYYNSSDGEVEMKINGKSFTVNTADYAEYTVAFDGSKISTISLETTGSKRGYIKSIKVVKGEELPPVEKHIGQLTGMYDNTAIENEAEVSVIEGTAFTFAAENADEITVKSGDGEPIALQVTDGSASWTPEVCQATPVTVTATMNGETPETATLSFTLTVEADMLVKEVINAESFGYTTNAYAQKTYTSPLTSISYSAVASYQNGGLTFNSGNSGIGKSSELVVTSNKQGYKLKKVEIAFVDGKGNDKGILVYAQNANYTPTDVSTDNHVPPTKSGELLGTLGTGTDMTSVVTVPADADYTRVALYPNTTGVISMTSITVSWEPGEAEAPGEVAMTVADEYAEFATVSDEDITIEEGVSLTFSAEGADKIAVYDLLDEAALIAEAEGETITWTPADEYIFNVVATNAGGTSEYPMTELNYIPFTGDDLAPVYEQTEADGSKAVTFSCSKGKLMVKTDEAEWAAGNSGAKLYNVDLSAIETGAKVTYYAKAVSVDGTKESEVISLVLTSNGIYEAPGAPVFDAPVYNDYLVIYEDGYMLAEEDASVTFSAQGATSIKIVGMYEDGDSMDEVFAEGEDTVTWIFTNPGEYLFNVIAENESGEVYFAQDDIDLEVFEADFKEDASHIVFEINPENTHLHISTTAGVLKIKKTPIAAEPATVVMRAESDDWFDPSEHSRLHKEELAALTEPVRFSAMTVTENGAKVSNALEKIVDNSGILAGIDNVTADRNNAPVEYFNLQGQRVQADRPGIYIVRRGNEVTKVVL